MSESGGSYPAGGQPPASGGEQPPVGSQPPYGNQPPASGWGTPDYPQGPGGPMDSYGGGGDKSFFGALFDFSFSSFVTPKIVKFVYVLATVLLGLGVLIFVGAGFANSATAGVVALIIAPLIALVYLAFIRMTLEFYFALVRMSEDINRRLPLR